MAISRSAISTRPISAKPAAAVSSGAISGTASWTWGQSGTLTGAGALSGTSAWVWGQSGTLTGSGALSGSSAWVWGQSGTLAGAGALTGSSAWTWGQSGTIVATGALSGTSAWVWNQSGDLTSGAAGAISGTASWTWGATATLTGTGAADTGVTPAGGPAARRRRWQVDYKGEVREFTTAQEAHDWIAHEIAEDKRERKAAVQQAKKDGRKAIPQPAPKPEIRFDGVEVTRWRYQGRSIADQVINGDYLAKLARHIQDRLDEEDDAEAIMVIH